jgi:hypothetical protein
LLYSDKRIRDTNEWIAGESAPRYQCQSGMLVRLRNRAVKGVYVLGIKSLPSPKEITLRVDLAFLVYSALAQEDTTNCRQ